MFIFLTIFRILMYFLRLYIHIYLVYRFAFIIIFFRVSFYLYPGISLIFQAPGDCNFLFYLFVYTILCLKFYRYEENCTYQWSLIRLGIQPVYSKIVRCVNSNLPYLLNCNKALCLITKQVSKLGIISHP